MGESRNRENSLFAGFSAGEMAMQGETLNIPQRPYTSAKQGDFQRHVFK